MKLYSNPSLIFAAILGIIFSFLLGWFFYSLETKSITHDFQNDVQTQVSSIERELRLNLESLHAIKGVFESSQNVTEDEFKRLTASIFSRNVDIQALEWIPKVLKSERKKYENAHHNRHPEFEIIERKKQGHMIRATERDEYFPVYYVEPLVGNEMAFGFDLASNPTRREALNKARDTGKLVVTGSIKLVQETSSQKGFLAFLPIYKGQPITEEHRRSQLQGFVLGVFRIGDLINSSLSHAPIHGINITIFDESTPGIDTLYTVTTSKRTDFNPAINYEIKLQSFGGRQWRAIATPSVEYIASRRSYTPTIITVLGFIFVGFSIVYTYLLLRRSIAIEIAVVERTRELNIAKDELEKITLLDGLTNIANRRHFDTYLDQEWRRALRDKKPLSLIMIDVDFFKQFNDQYGHLTGDSCLKEIATALKETVHRASDLVARFGGEEFVIIVPNIADVFTLAELCRLHIENLGIPHLTSSIADHVTISIGFNSAIPTKNTSPIDLIGLADKSLYEAKSSGRNKSCSIESDI
ncbi:MAG: CHASE domain-containing protein [Piscirickettsiaceae bacterium]|nr:CHASE domain-containing protein [Piscirickettsiaceae bacterium]